MATTPATTQLNLFGQPAVGQGAAPGQQPPSNGLGLMGQPSQQNTTSLFGQQTQTTATSSQQKSLFGGNFSASGQPQPVNGAMPGGMGLGATGQQSLFGQQPAGQSQQNKVQVNVSLGGGQLQQQAPAQQNSLFGQAPAQSTIGGNLFGGQPTQTPHFNNPQQAMTNTTSLFSQQQQPGTQQLMPGTQQMMSQSFITNDEQKSQSEVIQLMNVYKSAVDPASDKNHFRGCLYNKVGKGVGVQHQKFLQQNIPVVLGNNTPVDQHKWIQAMEANPSKTQLVPTQISSIAELKERTLTVLKAVQDAKKRLEHAKERHAVVEKSCDSDIQKMLESTRDRNQAVKNRLCQVFGKFERILTEQGRVQVDKRPQEQLIAHQRELLRNLCSPQTGLLHKIDHAKRLSHEALVKGEEFRGSDTFDGKIDGKEMDKQLVADADLRDILRVLQQQKQGIDTLQRSVRESASQIIVMEKEVNI